MKRMVSFLIIFSIISLSLVFIVTYGYAAEPQWVLVDVIDGANETKWDEQNTSSSYRYYPGYSRGTYSVKTEYIGETDNYYNPPYIHGESLTVEAKWSIPPQTIRKDETVSLNVSIAATNNTLSAFKFSGATSAWLGNSRIATRDGKDTFKVDYGNNYSSQSGTVTTTLGRGSEGQRMIIELNFYSSNSLFTQYVYEWSSTKTPVSLTKEEVIVPEPKRGPAIDSNYTDSGIKVSDLYGEVVIRRGDNEDGWELLEIDTVIYEGDHIKTSYDSGVILSMQDMTTFNIKPESEIIVTLPENENNIMKLVAGNIYINVKKMITHGIMEVEMSQAVAGIKGTTLILEETGSKSTLKVLEGNVEYRVKKTGEAINISAGNQAVVDNTSENIQKTGLNIASEAKKWNKTIIELQINNKYMKINGVQSEIDPGKETVPTVVNGRTLIPIRAVFEAMGGTVGYEPDTRKIILKLQDKTLEMWIDGLELKLDNVSKKMDTAPIIINGRTMVPVRFVAENFGYDVQWKEIEKRIIIQ